MLLFENRQKNLTESTQAVYNKPKSLFLKFAYDKNKILPFVAV